MPDSPDYARYLPNSNRFSLSDMGELAVRLGAITRMDRRGEVVWQDDFRYGLSNWNTQLGGAGSSFNIQAGTGYQSPYFCRIVSGAANGSQPILFRRIEVPQLTTIAMELGIRPFTNFGRFSFSFQTSSPTLYGHGTFKLEDSARKFYLLNGSSSYIEVGTLTYTPSLLERFIIIKLVINLQTAKYKRLIIGADEFSVGDITIPSGTSSALHQVYLYSYLENIAASSGTIDLSHVIITANEP